MGSIKRELDIFIIGAGFSGIYQLYLARKAGFHARVVDRAGDVGGTWYWNRYPGAMSDSEAYIYRFSWDKELLQTWQFKDRYVKQPDSLAYLEYVVEKHDLRRDMEFDVNVISIRWVEDEQRWHTETSQGNYVSKYVVTALGLLTTASWPIIQGLHDFQGELYHTSRFPWTWDFTGKRVGIIGNGSTGVQVITQLGKEKKVGKLISFQRSPQYSVPSGDRPITKEERDDINQHYDEIWHTVKNSKVGFGIPESDTPAMSVSAEERQRRFQESWDRGNAFRFLWTFSDIFTNRESNIAACDFIKGKIREIVKDPETARKLMPRELYARRPLCDGGYYHVFNEPWVEVVNVHENPIERITEKGVLTKDGVEHELDILICATGYDGVDGSFKSIQFEGVGGTKLDEVWLSGPKTWLGIMSANYPNLFMISGPLGPMSNQPPASEIQVEYVHNLLEKARTEKIILAPRQEAQDEWANICEKSTHGNLQLEAKSWFFGYNVPGKHHAPIYYFKGLNYYREYLDSAVTSDFADLKKMPANDAST